ncbi:MAG: metal-sensing transcriptional repressor [bacterium]
MPSKKLELQHHTNRIVGQVGGIAKMIENKKDSSLIIDQIMAARASLGQLALRLLQTEAKKCDKKHMDKIVATLFKYN